MLARKRHEAVEPSDVELICCGQNAAQKIIDRKVKEEKANHPSLPEASLRQMTMQGSACVCKVAHSILAKEQKQ